MMQEAQEARTKGAKSPLGDERSKKAPDRAVVEREGRRISRVETRGEGEQETNGTSDDYGKYHYIRCF
jgi:hypothetical protein